MILMEIRVVNGGARGGGNSVFEDQGKVTRDRLAGRLGSGNRGLTIATAFLGVISQSLRTGGDNVAGRRSHRALQDNFRMRRDTFPNSLFRRHAGYYQMPRDPCWSQEPLIAAGPG